VSVGLSSVCKDNCVDSCHIASLLNAIYSLLHRFRRCAKSRDELQERYVTIVTGDTVTGDTVTGDTVTGDTVTGDTVTGDTVTGDDVTGDTVTGDTVTGDTVFCVLLHYVSDTLVSSFCSRYFKNIFCCQQTCTE